MREIKFRAWDKAKSKMIAELICFYSPESQVKGTKDWGISHSNDFNAKNGYMWNFRNLIPMKYTGLKDKNKKEIYRKDIIKINGHIFSPMNFIVKWSDVNHCWWLSSIKEDYHGISVQSHSFSTLNGFENDSEIIGNIYENPELLEN